MCFFVCSFFFDACFSNPSARYFCGIGYFGISIEYRCFFHIHILLWMTPAIIKQEEIVGELGNQFAAIIICWPSIFGCDRRDLMWKTCAFFIVLHLFCCVLSCLVFNVRHAACNHNSSYLNCLFDVCSERVILCVNGEWRQRGEKREKMLWSNERRMNDCKMIEMEVEDRLERNERRAQQSTDTMCRLVVDANYSVYTWYKIQTQ